MHGDEETSPWKTKTQNNLKPTSLFFSLLKSMWPDNQFNVDIPRQRMFMSDR